MNVFSEIHNTLWCLPHSAAPSLPLSPYNLPQPSASPHQLIRHVVWCRGSPFCKMELSESVQRGLQSLADQSVFDHGSFQVLVDVSFRSLLSSHGDPTVLGELLPLRAPLLLSPRLLPVSLRVWACGGVVGVCGFLRLCCALRIYPTDSCVYFKTFHESEWPPSAHELL